MRVGIIGLGRMGEGMSRRMMKDGIEVWDIGETMKKHKNRMKMVMLMELPLILQL